MTAVPDLDTSWPRPSELTDENLDQIIAFLRAQRANYGQGADKKAGTKPKPIVNLSLDDLGL